MFLPEPWKATLPKHDQKWVSKALFTANQRGKPELVQQIQIWNYPPQPLAVCSRPPLPDLYFARPLLLWMPYRMWRVQLKCLHQNCKHQLTGAGLDKTVRQVVDLSTYYNLATEYLQCSKCHKKYSSWSKKIQFPVILTYRYTALLFLYQQFTFAVYQPQHGHV